MTKIMNVMILMSTLDAYALQQLLLSKVVDFHALKRAKKSIGINSGRQPSYALRRVGTFVTLRAWQKFEVKGKIFAATWLVYRSNVTAPAHNNPHISLSVRKNIL
jgi:hypothetical protein